MPHRLVKGRDGRMRAIPDVAPSPMARATLIATAKTLRYWGARGVQLTPGELLVMAAEVESYDPAADDLSTACCPLCEEMECDGDCPLAEVRADA